MIKEKQKLKNIVRRLTRAGYEIKHTSFWWVDGTCGYLVAGYYDTRKEAVLQAMINIRWAQKNHIENHIDECWLTNSRIRKF